MNGGKVYEFTVTETVYTYYKSIVIAIDLPKTGHKSWLRSKLEELWRVIVRGSHGQPDVQYFPPLGATPPQNIPSCTGMFVTRFALQFKCSGCDVDLLMSYDWELDFEGYRGLYSLIMSCDARDEETRQW